MIGKGGFGPVYKANLSTGQEIAVKRLANNSGQGVEEFKSEWCADDERSKFLSWRKRGDDKEANTKRIAGTYGYMSPEYATDGNFSMKSDVFSFGVILLEIVSGKKNRGFRHPDHHLNLLGHAWVLWNNGRALEVKDPKQPGFFTERGFIPGTTSSSKDKSHTENTMSITTLDGR
ncbi:hypothetical protein Q3G72_013622 [Acer saccharum]|nr:hypothetical protein Q3G72_013622 [Acer saccharum]